MKSPASPDYKSAVPAHLAAFYHVIADNVHDFEFWLDPEGRYLYVSPSCERITGHRPEEFQADPELRFRISHPEDRALLEQHRAEVEDRLPGRLEYRIVLPDGSVRWLGHVCQPAYDEAGKFIGTRGSNRDITEQKLAEVELKRTVERLTSTTRELETASEALRRQNDELAATRAEIERGRRRYQELFELAPDPYLVTDERGIVREANTAADNLLRGAEPALPGRNLADLLSPADRPSFPEVLARVAGTTSPVTIEMILHAPGQNPFPAIVTAAGTDGRAAGSKPGYSLRWLIRNITAQRQTETEVARVSRLYAVLSRVNEAIARTRSRDRLLEQVCDIVCETGGFPLAWVGVVEDPESGPRDAAGAPHPVRMLAAAGPAQEFLRGIRFETDGPHGQGPSGTAIRENRAVVSEDLAADPVPDPWRAAALGHGLRSSAAFPLQLRGRPIGVLTVYARQPGAFDPGLTRLLDTMTGDVSHALQAMGEDVERMAAESDLRQANQELEGKTAELAHQNKQLAQTQATLRASEERFRALIEQSPVAITYARAGKTLYANPAYLRMFGFPDAGELIGRALVEQIVPRCRDEILERLRIRAQGGPAPSVYETVGLRKDGSEFPFAVEVSQVVLVDGPATIGFFTDVTERERNAAETRQHIAGLSVANSELGRFNRLMIDRELRMVELKQEVNELRRQSGQPPRYQTLNGNGPAVNKD